MTDGEIRPGYAPYTVQVRIGAQVRTFETRCTAVSVGCSRTPSHLWMSGTG
jgi:hypothetical protein